MLHWRSNLNIPFTSKKYREFIFSRIMIEREMDVEFWIFSNRDPFKLFYNVFEVENVNFFSRINDEYKDTTCIDYAQIMYFLNNETINNLTKKEREIKIIKLLERHKFPFSKKDHIFELLKEIGVEFIDYFNWLFDDFKKIVKDEVGFIFFEEFLNYHNIITQSKDIVYNNSILELINDYRLASFGNYDAIFAKVVNFTWTFTNEGKYDITIKLISLGDVIESLKANTLLGGLQTQTTEIQEQRRIEERLENSSIFEIVETVLDVTFNNFF
jgi:hypothetical protein